MKVALCHRHVVCSFVGAAAGSRLHRRGLDGAAGHGGWGRSAGRVTMAGFLLTAVFLCVSCGSFVLVVSGAAGKPTEVPTAGDRGSVTKPPAAPGRLREGGAPEVGEWSRVLFVSSDD